MINPREATPSFAILPHTLLYAVVANANSKGELPPEGDPQVPQGWAVCFSENSCVTLADNMLWIVRQGTNRSVPSGTVLQRFAPGKSLARTIGGNEKTNPWFHKKGAPKLVVSEFATITAADRAMRQAMDDELSDIRLMRALDNLGNEALAHALYTDLRKTIPLEQHRANVEELKALARASTGKLAREITQFLRAMENPYDKTNRYNVWRKVLIMRAIQRRARAIAEGKTSRTEQVIVAQSATASYIAGVCSFAERVMSVLENRQPWWTQTGVIPGINARRRLNFAKRLNRDASMLESICANPFRPWAILAADRVRKMSDGLRKGNLQQIGAWSQEAIGFLEAICIHELVSRGMVSMRDSNETHIAHEAFTRSISWMLQTAPMLKVLPENGRVIVVEAQTGQRSTNAGNRLAHLRRIEHVLLEIGIAHAG